MIRRALISFACALMAAAPAAAIQGQFSVPASRALAADAKAASAALAAGDLESAAFSLGRLLDANPGALIENQAKPGAWLGASHWAHQQLASAPPELAVQLGRDRRAEAQAAFERLPQDTRSATIALLNLTQRFPATPAANRACLLLGDTYFESGDGIRARAAWAGSSNVKDPNLESALALRLKLPIPAPIITPAPKLPPVLEGFWSLDLPRSSTGGYVDYYSLRPVAMNGRVWINTGLRVISTLAANGGVIWDSGEPFGWERLSSWARRELSRGIGVNDLTNGLASDGRVVVAPQQLPFTDGANDQIEGLTITVSLPERRLFAFDANTGKPLWDHTPRNLLPGTNLPYQERARIAAPPVIDGRLVLVPSYELVGRVNLHVTAYDLFTGEIVWDRLIASGQTRVNLFGEHESEFNTAPVTVHQGRVLVCTNLGVIACLELDSGAPIWTDSYTRYEMPRNRGNFTPQARRRWHNSAPAAHGDNVMIAPVDSPNLLDISLATGLRQQLDGDDLEWLASKPMDTIVDLDHVVAVGPEVVWLGGDYLVAFKLPELGQDPRDMALQFLPISTPNNFDVYSSPAPRPRALATKDGHTLLAATSYGVIEVDRHAGSVRDLGPEDQVNWAPGNLAVDAGRLIISDESSLYGWVSWNALIAENQSFLARAEERGQSEEVLASIKVELGRAYLRRSATQPDPTADLQASRDFLLGKAGESLELQATVSYTGLVSLRFDLLRSEAALLVRKGRTREAITRYDQALKLAAAGVQEVAILFEQLRTLDVAQSEPSWSSKARASIVETLYVQFPRDVVPTELTAELVASDPLETWMRRLDQDLGHLAADLGDDLFERVPLGYLSLLAQASASARNKRPSLQLSSLHTALWEYGGVEIFIDAYDEQRLDLGQYASTAIETVLTRPGGLKAYESFEADASKRMQMAATAELVDRADILRSVIWRYPHSKASSKAEVDLLNAELDALEASPPASANLAALARAAMPLARRTSSDQIHTRTRAFLALARGAAFTGNLDLARLFAQRLVEIDPGNPAAQALAGSASDTGQALASAYDRRELTAPMTTADGLAGVRLGSFTPVLDVRLDTGEELLLVANSSGDLMAFDADSGGQSRWAFPGGGYASAPWSERAVALPEDLTENICILAGRSVIGITPSNGYLKWSYSPSQLRPVNMVGAGGLLAVTLVDGSGNLHVQGLDALNGTLLWSFSMPVSPVGGIDQLRLFLVGSRLVVMDSHKGGAAFVLDSTCGQALGDLGIPADVSAGDRAAAWSDPVSAQLFIPRMLAGTSKRSNVLDVFQLQDQFHEPAFSIPFEAHLDLAAIIHAPSSTYLWMRGTQRGAKAQDQLLQVDAQLGGLRQVADLQGDERPLGVELGDVLEIDSDLLLVASSPGSQNAQGSMTLRAIDLPLGPLWSAKLKAPDDPRWSIYDGPMPPALISPDTAAVVFALSGSHAALGQEAHLLLLDLKSGAILQDSLLSSRLGRISGLKLDGVSRELFLFGSGSGSGRGRLEVLIHEASQPR